MEFERLNHTGTIKAKDGSSPFIRARQLYEPRYPRVLKNIGNIVFEPLRHLETVTEDIKQQFPLTYSKPLIRMQPQTGQSKPSAKSQHFRVGIVLSGGPAPGGHNVICGLADALFSFNSSTELIGFLGGPSGIIENRTKPLTAEYVNSFRNTGGFDMLGSGRSKIETDEEMARCRKVCEQLQLDALVIIGGDDSNTNAAVLAEDFQKHNIATAVIGVPKTIDGDLKNEFVETSFGFDTAVRLYAELVSNIARDAVSSKKYYHFIRLMGRAASHITMETALLTQPNVTLISEEVWQNKSSLNDVVESLVKVIVERAQLGKNYGVILVPEGLIEFIGEFKFLIAELNKILHEHARHFDTLSGFTERSEYVNHKLSKDASYVFSSLPINIQRQLLMDRDPHGNVQVSRIETEFLLIELVDQRLRELKTEGKFRGKFAYQRHFLGYEGRCAAPTNFDSDYACALGRNAAALAIMSANGYMSVIRNLALPRERWEALGVPLVSMMNFETRHGRNKPVIKKSLIDLKSKAFKKFSAERQAWECTDSYRFCGSIQYFGPEELCDLSPCSIRLEAGLSCHEF